MGKTLGQVATDFFIEAVSTGKSFHEAGDKVAQAVRSKVIEEAIETVSRRKHEYELNEDTAPAPDAAMRTGAIHAVEAIVNDLTALKDKANDAS